MPKHSLPPLAVVDASTSPSIADPLHDLGEHGRALWALVTSQYRIEDAGGIELLRQACLASDRVAALRERINQDGEIIAVRGVPREHPGLKAELAGRAFVCRTLVRLGLNVEALNPSVGRPGRGFGWRGFE
jgi:hypothetical protein